MATYTLPYRDVLGHGHRPYLALQITGVNGRSGAVWGLVDSGADSSCLPLDFARLMDYDGADPAVQDAPREEHHPRAGAWACRRVAEALAMSDEPRDQEF